MTISDKLLQIILTNCKRVALECCEIATSDTLRVGSTMSESNIVCVTHITLVYVSLKREMGESEMDNLLYLLTTAPSMRVLHYQARAYDLIVPQLRAALIKRKEMRLPPLITLGLAGLSRRNSLLANLFYEFCTADEAVVENVVV